MIREQYNRYVVPDPVRAIPPFPEKDFPYREGRIQQFPDHFIAFDEKGLLFQSAFSFLQGLPGTDPGIFQRRQTFDGISAPSWDGEAG